jgi:hypothetical protein
MLGGYRTSQHFEFRFLLDYSTCIKCRATGVVSTFGTPITYSASRPMYTLSPESQLLCPPTSRSWDHTPHVSFICPSTMICICDFERSADVCSWVEGGELRCRVWLRVWLSFGWRLWSFSGECQCWVEVRGLTALRREGGLKSWRTWGTTGVLALSLLCQHRFRPFNVSQRLVASV